MSAKRPPAIQKECYIRVDYDALRESGELVPIGEPFVAPTITSKVPRGKFEIVYTADLFDIVDKLGNQKMQVLKYLLENKDGNNCLNMTNTQLAKAIGCSRPTVIDTLKIMADADLIKRENSVIMVSPNLMIKGNQQREAYLVRKYEEITQESYDAYQNAIDYDVDPQLSFTNSGEIVQKAIKVKE